MQQKYMTAKPPKKWIKNNENVKKTLLKHAGEGCFSPYKIRPKQGVINLNSG
ncbi:hypothetical protein VAEKB19_3900047 [Vibrio aestuarianus]|nr:hypothetical protein VAEKB19_3900047 [Vibrio aestuarianus]